MTPPRPTPLSVLAALAFGFALTLAVALPTTDTFAQAQPKGATKGAAAPPNAGARAQGQAVQFGQQGDAQPAAGPEDGTNPDPRQQMRTFISDISAYARSANSGFVVIPIDGLDLLEKVDPVDPTKRAPAATYIRSIDGVVVPDLNFHRPNERGDIKTDEKVHNEMLRLTDIGQKRGLRVWSIDYAKDAQMAQESIRFALSKSYVPFPARDDYRFARIPPGRPVNENPNPITGLNHAKNFLMLTDTSAWDTQEEFALAMANTNYDAVVVDVFHRGRIPFTARTIDSLKYKKLGTRRLVLAYVNIGEAETSRYFWKPNWKEGSPSFIGPPNASNPDKYTIQYWEQGWRDIIFGNPTSYIYGVIAQGFDGVVLDGVEAFRVFEGEQ